MAWLIGFDKDGKSHCGSDWSAQVKVEMHSAKGTKACTRIAERMAQVNGNIHTIYWIGNYTKKICEMDTPKGDEYVKGIGRLCYVRAES